MSMSGLRAAFVFSGVVGFAIAPAARAGSAFSESDAARIADATQAAWITMTTDGIEKPYAKNVVVFDPLSKVLVTTWEGFHKIQLGFVQSRMDGVTVPDRTIQVLDDATFVVSGTGLGTSTTGPQKQFQLRFTDVYRRQPDGKWLIVNEHISLVPRR